MSAPAPRVAKAGGNSAGETKKKAPPPPERISNKKDNTNYRVGDLLGEGGFARCYKAKQEETGIEYAVKVVPKQSLKNVKTRNKLLSEIRIHQDMNHPHIVQFHTCFEDTANVYLVLELCLSASLNDMIKKRKRFTVPEARYFFLQLVEATQYMHENMVIHRDLKLGNVFLGLDMSVKIGDFGLAAMLEDDAERKRTICGTPNYIAPEILFSPEEGHSFEVDVWSLGVILYTMLIGKPPFQTRDVKEIYKRIREIAYEFPNDVPIPDTAKDLIQAILHKDPEKRLRLDDIIKHPFFNGPCPDSLPLSVLEVAPDSKLFTHASIRRPSISMRQQRSPDDQPTAAQSAAASLLNRIAASAGVPISRSEPDPVSVQAAADIKAPRENATISRSEHARSVRDGSAKAGSTSVATKTTLSINDGLDSQLKGSAAAMPSSGSSAATMKDDRTYQYPPQTTVCRESNDVLEGMALLLDQAFARIRSGQSVTGATFESKHVDAMGKVRPPAVFVAKWMDYTNKYGLGYELTDGTSGVYFNDSSGLILSPNGQSMEYLRYNDQKTNVLREPYAIDDVPPELKKKCTLLGHFRNYMTENLYQPQAYCFKDLNRNKDLDYMSRFSRTKHGVIFRLSNKVVQINFFDHFKLILSDNAKIVSYIDSKNRQLKTLSLVDALKALSQTTVPNSPISQAEAVTVPAKNTLASKLKIARDILLQICQSTLTDAAK